jgi:cellulose synthase/poly-beta-1,6-N-acetylglucosamine synthase-like glycosyltransferase
MADIDVVVVGRNNGETLHACLQSIADAPYTRGKVRIYYVDRDSSDNSVEIARKFADCTLIEILCDPMHLSCALNLGWQAGGAPLVQFIDPDSTVDRDWFQIATKEMRGDIGAIVGQVEHTTDSNLFGWASSTEQRTQLGSIHSFGNNVLVRRSILDEIDGYDEGIKTEEALDLSSSVSRAGHPILGLGETMLHRPGESISFDHYIRRQFRQGRGLSAIAARRPQQPHPALRDTWLRGGIGLLCFIFALAGASHNLWWLILLFGTAFCLLYPRIFWLGRISRKYDLSHHDAARFGNHLALSLLPRFFGVLTESVRSLFKR